MQLPLQINSNKNLRCCWWLPSSVWWPWRSHGILTIAPWLGNVVPQQICCTESRWFDSNHSESGKERAESQPGQIKDSVINQESNRWELPCFPRHTNEQLMVPSHGQLDPQMSRLFGQIWGWDCKRNSHVLFKADSTGLQSKVKDLICELIL